MVELRLLRHGEHEADASTVKERHIAGVEQKLDTNVAIKLTACGRFWTVTEICPIWASPSFVSFIMIPFFSQRQRQRRFPLLPVAKRSEKQIISLRQKSLS
jgi:hypothetical protein